MSGNQPMPTIPCRLCGQGYLYTVKVHRLSGPAVYIGYIFLMPSLAAIALCLAFLLASWVWDCPGSVDTSKSP